MSARLAFDPGRRSWPRPRNGLPAPWPWWCSPLARASACGRLAEGPAPDRGEPILWHVLDAGLAAKPTKVVVVIGQDGDEVEAAVRSWGSRPSRSSFGSGANWEPATRSGGATGGGGRVTDVLVTDGDFDPVTHDDVKRLVASHRRGAAVATVASTTLDDPGATAAWCGAGPGRRDRGAGRRIAGGRRDRRGLDRLDRVPSQGPVRHASLTSTGRTANASTTSTG